MYEIKILLPSGQITVTDIRMKVGKKNIPGKKDVL